MLKLKKIMIFPVVIAFVLAGGFFGGMMFQNRAASNSVPAISSNIIANELTGISEYASLEYRYTNVGKFEDQGDFYGWKVPLTTKSFIITYDGVMKMGIRGEDIAIDVEENQILVTLPPAEILSHEIKEDTLEVFDQTRNIFNQILIEDYTTFAADRKKEMEKKALEKGLLQEAEERVEQQLALFIKSIAGADGDYEIVFKRQSSHQGRQ